MSIGSAGHAARRTLTASENMRMSFKLIATLQALARPRFDAVMRATVQESARRVVVPLRDA
jgi:hypothetical protein